MVGIELVVAAVASGAAAATSAVASDAFAALRAWGAQRLGRGIDSDPDLETEAKSTDPLFERIDLLRTQLSESAQLLPTLQAELELRVAALDRLQADAAHYEKLAALKQEEAEAVQRLVEQTVGKGLTETARLSGRQQALYFATGLAASIPLGIVANILYTWLTK